MVLDDPAMTVEARTPLDSLGIDSADDFAVEQNVCDGVADAAVVRSVTAAWHVTKMLADTKLDEKPLIAPPSKKRRPTLSIIATRPKARTVPPACLLQKPLCAIGTMYKGTDPGKPPPSDDTQHLLDKLFPVASATASSNVDLGAQFIADHSRSNPDQPTCRMCAASGQHGAATLAQAPIQEMRYFPFTAHCC